MIALIILLCIVVMLVRWSYKKSVYAIDKGKVIINHMLTLLLSSQLIQHMRLLN